MRLDDLQRTWETLGETDPFWAILTDPSKKNNRWDPEEFFATGDTEIDCLMDSVAALSISLKLGRALDFGCGVGRLTQALCRHFKECVGVDIAASMIRRARAHNRFGDRCQYYVNEADDLRIFAAHHFDFIYSNIVLQHIPPKYSARYIQDFVRVLAPGGLAVFQVPSEVARGPAGPSTDTLFNASITAFPSALAATAGATVQLHARVRNTSGQTWPARSALLTKYKFRLGNHWLTALGEMMQMNDGRTDLTEDLKRSEETSLSLTVTAPAEPGEYILELDMVQEHVTWFRDKGSRTCRVPVHVTAPSDSPSPLAATLPVASTNVTGSNLPEMAMYYLPRTTVIETVTRKGARVLNVEEYASAGANFVSYRYYILK